MRVRPTREMSPADFSQHMNYRHASSGELSSMTHVTEHTVRSAKDRAVWEAYHSRLHRTGEYEHEH